MCPRKTGVKITEIKGYTISKYHEGKKLYVDFYAIDPTDKATRRKKYYITATTKKQGRMMAARLIDTLTIKLSQGWSPWAERSVDKSAKQLVEIIDSYTKQFGNGHRKKSILNYTSRAKILKEYIGSLRLPGIYADNFDKAFITDFLDWPIGTRGISARTRNNYLGWLSSLLKN